MQKIAAASEKTDVLKRPCESAIILSHSETANQRRRMLLQLSKEVLDFLREITMGDIVWEIKEICRKVFGSVKKLDYSSVFLIVTVELT